MFAKVMRSCLATGLSLLIVGCGNRGDFSKEFSIFGNDRVNIAGANQMLDPGIEGFDDRRLVAILDPADKLNLQTKETVTPHDVERAFQAANTIVVPDPVEHRNQIQERLILASQQACNFYKDYLKRLDAYQNFVLGSLTTILGGAASIVTGATGARILGGAAGITSGVNAEFSQAFFQNLAIHVITPGIDSRRDKKLKEIRQSQGNSIQGYNVQAAMRDALEYHNQCTLNAGLEEAADSIQTVRNPGLQAMEQTLLSVRRLQRIARAKPDEKIDPADLQETVAPGGMFRPTVGTINSLRVTGSVLLVLASERKRIEGLRTSFSESIDYLKNGPFKGKNKDTDLEGLRKLAQKAADQAFFVIQAEMRRAAETKDTMIRSLQAEVIEATDAAAKRQKTLMLEQEILAGELIVNLIAEVRLTYQSQTNGARGHLEDTGQGLDDRISLAKGALEGAIKKMVARRAKLAKEFVNKLDPANAEQLAQINKIAAVLGLAGTGATAKTAIVNLIDGAVAKLDTSATVAAAADDIDKLATAAKKAADKDL